MIDEVREDEAATEGGADPTPSAPSPDADRDASVEFAVDDLSPTAVTGWAWHPAAPERPVHVELVSATCVVAATLADTHRVDLEAAGKGDGRCGFTLALPEGSIEALAPRLALRDAGADLPFHVFDRDDLLFRVDYAVDAMDEHGVVGWAWTPRDPAARLTIEFVDGDVVVAETVADLYRDDLERAGLAGGTCMFRLPLPLALRDGRARRLGLRRAGALRPFHLFEERRFGEIRADLAHVTPFAVEGSVWLAQFPEARPWVEIRLDDHLVHAGETDGDHGFAWRIDPATAAPVFADHGAEATSRPGEAIDPSARETTVALTVSADDQTLWSQSIPVWVAPDRSLAVHFEDFGPRRIAGTLLARDATAAAVEMRIDDRPVATLACDGRTPFAVDLAPLRLADGERHVRIGPIGDTGVASPAAILRPLAYERFDLDLDVVDDRIAGRLLDGWGTLREAGIELTIDGRPIAAALATASAAVEPDALCFSATISARWRDGRPHRLEARLLGETRRRPDRPILFRAGEPARNLLFRSERDEAAVFGFVVLPWAPDAVADVALVAGDRLVATTRADRPHPALAVEDLGPADRGFRLALPADAPAGLRLRVVHDGHVLVERPLPPPPGRFHLADAGYGRSGACFVVPDPFVDAQTREEARSVLFAAAAAARAGLAPVTVVFAADAVARRWVGIDLEALVVDLIGRAAAADLHAAAFVPLPAPALHVNATGAHRAAHALDLWVRANAFALVVGPSRSGLLAYCATSRRQGLLPPTTRVVVLAETFAVVDRLDREQLLDDPDLVVAEALERAGLAADLVFAPSPTVAAAVDAVLPGAGGRATRMPLEIGPVAPVPLPHFDDGRRWIVFAAPLRARSGLVVLCDAIDRLARRAEIDPERVGIAFVGTEDRVRGRPAADYLRDRIGRWPFAAVLRPDLTFDGVASVLAGFAATGIAVVPPGLAGSAWDAAAAAAGLARLDLDAEAVRPDDAAALAAALAATLVGARSAKPPTPPATGLGAALAALAVPIASAPIPPPPPPPPPRVAVCISHFNRPTLLRQTIASVLACGWPDLEIVVVDDGSTVPGVAEDLAAIETEFADAGLRLVRQENRYLGAARNAAARAATADLIVFMDDDNLAHPAMIEAFVETRRRTGADLVTSRFAFFDGTDAIDPAHDVPREIGVPLMPDLGVGVLGNCFGDANMLITRHAFEAIGGFTEDYGRGHEDWELFARAATLGLHHELLGRALFWYRVAPQSMLRGRETPQFDLLRNIRAYAHDVPVGIHRILLLAQGLAHRRTGPPVDPHLPARRGVAVAGRLAFGRVAIVMRTRDRPELLARAIDDVLAQSFGDWTLVVVDGGTDPAATRALLARRRTALRERALLVDDPTVTTAADAANAGIAHSASEFLVVHDDGDTWDPRFLEAGIAHLDRTPAAAAVVPATSLVVESLEATGFVEHERRPPAPIALGALGRLTAGTPFPSIAFLVRRSAVEAVGGFDRACGPAATWDLQSRIAERFRVDLLESPLAFRHRRTTGAADPRADAPTDEPAGFRPALARGLDDRLRRTLGRRDAVDGAPARTRPVDDAEADGDEPPMNP